jgi:hypothetical protein
LSLSLVGCGSSEGPGPDVNGEGDTDVQADTSADTFEDAGHDDSGTRDGGGECDPKEVAAERVAQNDTVNEGAVDFGSSGEVKTATIDARSGGVAEAQNHSFIYLDLDASKKLQLTDVEAFDNDTWDIAFRRTKIRLNSADSGPGPWLVSKMTGAWEDVTEPPSQGAEWSQDDFVDDECNVQTGPRSGIQTAFGQWYDYNPETHTVSAPDEVVWALYNASSHQAVKFQITAYTDATYEVRWTNF